MSEQPNKIATVFDSEQQHVGQVYARALLSAATEAKSLDRVVDELESFVAEVLDKSPGLEFALANPKMSIDEKSSMLDRAFAKKMDPTLLKFLKVTCRRHRMNCIRAIQQSASEQRDVIAGRVQVSVTLSQPLDAAGLANLTTKLKSFLNRDVRLMTSVDPSILGGLIVRVGDTVYDGSVDGQLNVLRKSAGAKAESTVRQRSDALIRA